MVISEVFKVGKQKVTALKDLNHPKKVTLIIPMGWDGDKLFKFKDEFFKELHLFKQRLE